MLEGRGASRYLRTCQPPQQTIRDPPSPRAMRGFLASWLSRLPAILGGRVPPTTLFPEVQICGLINNAAADLVEGRAVPTDARMVEEGRTYPEILGCLLHALC